MGARDVFRRQSRYCESRRARVGWLVAAVLPLGGCVDHLGEEHSSVGHVVRDCVVPVPPGVSVLGAPTSLEFPNESLWIWNSLALDDGRTIANAWAHVTNVDSVCQDGPTLTLDSNGTPQSLLSLTDDELKANAARTDGRALALAPTGGFVYDGVGYLFYEQNLLGPGVFESELVGTGLCVVSGDGACRRAEASGSSVLFPPSALPLNQGGLIAGDRALIFGCRQVASFSSPCTITGVPLDSLEDPTTYAYYNAFEGWVTDGTNATIILDHLGPLTVSAFDDRFIATTLDIFATEFDLQFANAPTGEYDRPITLFSGVPPDTFFPAGGRQHSGLRRDSRALYFSYFTNHAGAQGGLHLTSFAVNSGLQ